MLRWIGIAGAALTASGVAWLSKLAVIVATSGRVTDTGAAGLFFLLGFVLLLIGSTGVGLRLTMNRALPLRLLAALLSPIALIVLLVTLGAVLGPLVGDSGPDYAREEANIVALAVLSLAVGAMLLTHSRRACGAKQTNERRS